MNSNFPKTITRESLFLWPLHRMTEEFKEHAILKGGMALNLVDCPRSTNNLDYVLAPYKSKKEVETKIDKIIAEVPNARIEKTLNSKAIKITIRTSTVFVQIEANVSLSCKSIPISTDSLAIKSKQLGKVIRVMSFDVALSHKISAWNERRFLRDLYDIYFLTQILNEKPDMETLIHRLSNVQSRIPKLKSRKKMTLKDLKNDLQSELNNITMKKIDNELSALFNKETLQGLDIKIKAAINQLIETINKLSL